MSDRRLRAVSPAIDATAAGVVETFRRDGHLRVKTSLKPVFVIIACTLAFDALFLFAFASPNPDAGVAVAPLFGIVTLAMVVWILYLLIPRVRMVVDQDGIRVRGRQIVVWDDVTEFHVGVEASRSNQSYVLVERTDRAGRMIKAAKLPLLLAVDAAALSSGLTVILAEQRAERPSIQGRVRRWPQPS